MSNTTIESLSRLAVNYREDDPSEFDLTVATLLFGLDGEKYIDLFRKHNIGQSTLTELTLEDLEKIGVDDEAVRNKIITEVQNLPLYEENINRMSEFKEQLEPEEITKILSDTTQHLYHIQLSLLANRMALKKNKNLKDCLLYKDLYASDVALKTMDSISDALNSIEKVLDSNFALTAKKQKKKRKKMVIGVVGSSIVIVLSVLFYKSLKDVNVL